MWTVYTPPEQLDSVSAAFEAAKLPMQESKLAFVPKNKKDVAGRDAEVCLNLLDALDEHDDSQNVFSDFDISDEEMQRISEQG